MKFTEILHNEHFNRLAIICNVPFWGKKWQQDHPDVPFWSLWKDFDRATPVDVEWDKGEVISRFTVLITSITSADPRLLFYTKEDLDWFFGVLDGKHFRVTISLWKAWVSAVHEFVTPGELAEATGTSESNWRNKAAKGEIAGARKVGKNWLIPLALLKSQGVLPWDYKRPEGVETDDNL